MERGREGIRSVLEDIGYNVSETDDSFTISPWFTTNTDTTDPPEFDGYELDREAAERIWAGVREGIKADRLVEAHREDKDQEQDELTVAAERLLGVASRLEDLLDGIRVELHMTNGEVMAELPHEPSSRPASAEDLETRAFRTALAEIANKLQEVTEK